MSDARAASIDPTPYATLTPDVVLDALASVGWMGDGRLIALNSYENRVYQVNLEDGPPVIAKFYRSGRWSDAQILEEHAFLADLAESEVPAVPALTAAGATLHAYHDTRFAVFPRRGGRAPELDQAETLEWIGRFLGRIHAVGARQRFTDRPSLSIDAFGTEARQVLLDGPLAKHSLGEAYARISELVIARCRAAFETYAPERTLRLHGDCHIGNILWTDHGPHFVDFDDSRQGPAVQDLWMLLSGPPSERQSQFNRLMDGYEQVFEFDRRQLRLIEPLRSLRLIHYSAWIAQRWQDPAFPAAFSWFGTDQYWNDRVVELREQLEVLEDSPW